MKTVKFKSLMLILLGVIFIQCGISSLAFGGSTPYISNHGINFSSGNKYISETDVSLAGPVSTLHFSRKYNSRHSDSSMLGHGWTFTQYESLKFFNSINLAIFTRADGHSIQFRTTEIDGVWENNSGPKAKIITTEEGHLLEEPNGAVKVFNDQGKLIAQRDRNNNELSYIYADDRLVSINDGFGHSLTLQYYTSGNLKSTSSPAGIFLYSYDEHNNLISVQNPDESLIQYLYEDPYDKHNLTGKINETGQRVLTVAYDIQDRVISSKLADDSQAVTIEYQSGYRRVVTNSLGESTIYHLRVKNGIARVVAAIGPGCSSCGSETGGEYTYDTRNQILTSKNANGVLSVFSYDENGNRTSVTAAAGTEDEVTTTFTYDSTVKRQQSITMPSVSNPGENRVTSMSFDGNGNVLTRSETGFSLSSPISRTTTYGYDAYGRVISINGPLDGNDIVTLTYYANEPEGGDNRGYLHTVTNALGHTTTYSDYNAFGQAETITDENGLITTLIYNSRGLVKERITAGLSTAYEYDAAGDLQSVTLPGGRIISYSYSDAGFIERVTDSLGNYIKYSYDTEGHKTKQEIFDPDNALKSFLDYEYDANGRLYKILRPDESSEQMNYDAVGNIIKRTNGLNVATNYTYDNLNRLKLVNEPGGGVTTFTYDKHGNQTSVTDAGGNRTDFVHDDFGNRILRTSADTGITSYAYDFAGNLISKTDAKGITVSYNYDLLNRLVLINYPDSSQDVTYFYDEGRNGIGRLTGIQDGTSTTIFRYNSLGSLVQEEKSIKGRTFIVSYGYNGNQELISVTYPSGRVIHYDRDLTGKIQSVTSVYQGLTENIAENLVYLPFGPAMSMTFGNGLELTKSYDQLYRVAEVKATGIYDRSYSYLATGQVHSITNNIDTAASQSFGYDDLGRLTGAAGKYGNFNFTYDNVGNRMTQTLNELTTNYNYIHKTNKISQVVGGDTIDYSYDEVGNTITKGDQEFTWSDDNRLLAVHTNADLMGEYGYDARGLRTLKTTSEETILSIYDSGGNLLAEADDEGDIIREYVYLEGERLTLFDHSPPPEFLVTTLASKGGVIANVKSYAFDENNRYTGVKGTADLEGKAIFDRNMFGNGSYTFRVDYLGAQFWSEAVLVKNSSGVMVTIEVEEIDVTVIMDGMPQQGCKVYVFSDSGKYLGIFAVTDENGQVNFNLPVGQSYKFRVNLLGNEYWSGSTIIAAAGEGVVIDTNGGTLKISIEEDESLPLTGIKTYLYNADNKYLGLSATSDANGEVAYCLSAGVYKIRADYLGYQFWSENFSLADGDKLETFHIPHQDVSVLVFADLSGTLDPLVNVSCYLFNPSGKYLGITSHTDETGKITLHLPERDYRVRADYLGQKFWSEDFGWQDSIISIPHGTGVIDVAKMGEPLEDIKVYTFNTSGTYLGRNEVTNSNGKAFFILPSGEYRFRADYQGNQYWGEDLSLLAHQENPVQISTGGGSFVLTLSDQQQSPLVGVRTYVFNEAGSYLGEYAGTDNRGQVSFNLADGNYKLRVDYLGKEYWTDTFSIPLQHEIQLIIEHQQVAVHALTAFNGSSVPIEAATVYLFTPAGSYLNMSSSTDGNGQAFFYLPADEYKVRLDYFGSRYFSEIFSGTATTVSVAQGQILVNLSRDDQPLVNVPIHVFSSSDQYLNLKGSTEEDGKILFQIPAGFYKFRADYQSNHFWAGSEVAADIVTEVDLQTGGGSLVVTVRTGESSVLAGASCYLFNSSGRYLGQKAQTDGNGVISFDVSDGSYMVRVDYLGYQYWSEMVTVPEMLSTTVLIEHYDVAITVNNDNGSDHHPIPGIRCYLFTESGSFTGIYSDSDENGRVHFSVPLNPYKVRADYLGRQFWSESFNAFDTAIDIAHGDIELMVTDDEMPVVGKKVYLFSESGSYLGLSSTTDTTGKVTFTVPAAAYKMRIDYNSKQYWTDVLNVIAYQNNPIEFSIDDLAASLINDPFPVRYDGEGPVYSPLLASSSDSMVNMLAEMTASTSPLPEAQSYYYISDHLGTAQLVTDKNGEVVWRGEYSSFGEVDVVIDIFKNNFRFPGQYFDAETGLHYNWHRFYDPETGRYISADPIGLAGGINLYAYVAGDPINAVDPEGLSTTMPGVGPLPFPIPPVAIPGSPENKAYTDAATGLIDSLTNSEEKCEEKKTCAEKYPDIVKCDKLYRYHLWSATKDTQVVKNYLRNERGRSGGISVKKDGNARSGPCVNKGGEHYKIRQGGGFIGTCNMCPCCEDTPSGAIKWYAWDVNAY